MGTNQTTEDARKTGNVRRRRVAFRRSTTNRVAEQILAATAALDPAARRLPSRPPARR